MPQGETKIYLAVMLAIPFLAVRTIYSILADFENNSTFGILDGNAYVQLGMAVIEEMIVTAMFIGVGLVAPRMAEEACWAGVNGCKAGGCAGVYVS